MLAFVDVTDHYLEDLVGQVISLPLRQRLLANPVTESNPRVVHRLEKSIELSCGGCDVNKGLIHHPERNPAGTCKRVDCSTCPEDEVWLDATELGPAVPTAEATKRQYKLPKTS